MKMILASAQTEPGQKNIKENLEDHYQMIELASEHGANLIAFPEMSITGYEIENAGKLSFTKDDVRLNKLRKLSSDLKIIVVAGAPVRIKTDLHIGSFILFPDNSISIYTKQYLHPGEEVSFEPSFDYNPKVEIGNEKLSFAICADIDNPVHPESACRAFSTTYIASIFFSKNGIPKAHEILGSYSEKHSMNILMANFCGKTWGLVAGGRSAFWDKKRNLIVALDNKHPGLLIVENSSGIWTGKTINEY